MSEHIVGAQLQKDDEIDDEYKRKQCLHKYYEFLGR